MIESWEDLMHAIKKPVMLQSYGPGPESGELNHLALVIERNKEMTWAVTLRHEQSRCLEISGASTPDFDRYHKITPTVPASRLAELMLAHGRHLGATAEALTVIGSLVHLRKGDAEHMTQLSRQYTPRPEKLLEPEAGPVPAPASNSGKKPVAPKKPVMKAGAVSPAPKTASPAKGGRPAKEDESEKTVALKKAPKEGVKMPPQMKKMLEILGKAPGQSFKLKVFIKSLEGKIETKQPVERIWDFYRKRLISEGWVTVK